jgi:hypothetical protein
VEGVWGDRGDSGIRVRIKGVKGEESRVLHTHEACGGGRSEMGEGGRWSVTCLALGSGGSLALAPRSA